MFEVLPSEPRPLYNAGWALKRYTRNFANICLTVDFDTVCFTWLVLVYKAYQCHITIPTKIYSNLPLAVYGHTVGQKVILSVIRSYCRSYGQTVGHTVIRSYSRTLSWLLATILNVLRIVVLTIEPTRSSRSFRFDWIGGNNCNTIKVNQISLRQCAEIYIENYVDVTVYDLGKQS